MGKILTRGYIEKSRRGSEAVADTKRRTIGGKRETGVSGRVKKKRRRERPPVGLVGLERERGGSLIVAGRAGTNVDKAGGIGRPLAPASRGGGRSARSDSTAAPAHGH